MSKLRVLIVEDEPLAAMVLQDTVAAIASAVVMVAESVFAAEQLIDETLHFAFLDIDVTDGKTFEVARLLDKKRVPFVFVSGSVQTEIPVELQNVPFIPKPFRLSQIERALRTIIAQRQDDSS